MSGLWILEPGSRKWHKYQAMLLTHAIYLRTGTVISVTLTELKSNIEYKIIFIVSEENRLQNDEDRRMLQHYLII